MQTVILVIFDHEKAMQEFKKRIASEEDVDAKFESSPNQGEKRHSNTTLNHLKRSSEKVAKRKFNKMTTTVNFTL